MALTTGSDSARRSNSERSTSSGGSHRSASGKVCPQCSEVDAFDSDGRTCTKCGVVQEWPLQPELREEGAAEACWHFAAALCIMCMIRRAGAEPYGAGNTSTGIKRKGPTKITRIDNAISREVRGATAYCDHSYRYRGYQLGPRHVPVTLYIICYAPSGLAVEG